MNDSATLIAAGVFGSIGMLAWASAALLPLLLHLWNRRKHREAPWAAMEFLLAAVQEQARRIRLEQILLLLLRMAIPIVLALALADPNWQMLPSLGSSLSSRTPQHHLFVFDLSYSMGYQIENKTRLEQAKQLAREIIEGSPQGDGFTIVTLSNPSEIVISSPAFSPDDALAEIAGLELQDNQANLTTALDLVKQTLENVRANFTRLGEHRVYFLSDMGETTWQVAMQTQVRDRIGEIEAWAGIVTIDVGAQNTENAGIAAVRRNQQVVTPNTVVTWQVAIDDFVGNSTGDREVEMLVDAKLAAKKTVTLGSGTPAAASFQYQFDASGEHTVRFHLADDALPVDNHRFESITVRDNINVLCVEGKANAARNVALALAPRVDSSIRVRTVPDHRLSETLLYDFDVIFLCNVGRFTAQRAAQMRDFLKRGHSIVMFLGDLASPENYNQLLGGGDNHTAILPATLVELSPAGNYQLSPGNYQHPIVQPFRGQERAGLLTTPVFRYMRTVVAETSSARVALEFTNGDPAIVEQTLSEFRGGRFTLVAIAPSDQSVSRQAGQLSPWTAWSAWPSFPPLIQEMFAFSVASQDTTQNVNVGQPISATLPAGSGTQYVAIQLANGKSRRVPVQQGTDSAPPTWSHGETLSSGFYTAEIPDLDKKTVFAVNLADTKESQLQRTPMSDLPSQFRQGSIAAATDEASTNLQMASTPLFRLVLGLLLLLLLGESYFAWYLGNARS